MIRHIAAAIVAIVIIVGMINMLVLMGHDRRMLPWLAIALALFCSLLVIAGAFAGRRTLAKVRSSKR
jgi:uncharacterized membrane protein YfcA